MKANELMVGDYVYNHRNWECPIVEIHKNSAVVIAKYYGEEEFLLSDLRPIPLTVEILEKNGWKSMKNGSGDFILTKPMVSSNSATITKTINRYEMSHGVFIGLGIHYVHQLQHALRLCGIEKRNCVMKANAPKKIYVSIHLGIHHYEQKNNDNIEYIQTDVFIEKACNLLARMIWEITYEDLEGDSTQHYDKMEFIKDFVNYMKGE